MMYPDFIEKILLPFVDFCRKTSFVKFLNYWRQLQFLSSEKLAELQQAKIASLLAHTIQNIPQYAHLQGKTNLTIKEFPVTYKADIKQNIDAYMWHPQRKHQFICEKSSGSSGIQGIVYISKNEQSKIIALQTLLWEWAGYKLGTAMLQTGITPNRSAIKRIKDITFNVHYEAAFGLQEDAIKTALLKFRKKKGAIFGGYASSLYVYAQVAEKYNLQVEFKSVISWGDKLFDHYRSTIETAFNCKVYDIYGTTEGFVISGQYDLQYQYIITPQVYVELLDESGNEVEDGQIGHVVVTHLDNYEMPLIRYYLGDLAIKLPISQYPAERKLNFPLFQKIIGRDTDIIITPKGNKMVVHSFTGIFEHLPQIKQFRVIQENVDSITIEYIPDLEHNFTEQVLTDIKNRIYKELNEAIEIIFTQVESIPNSPSGKPQIIVSTIKNN